MRRGLIHRCGPSTLPCRVHTSQATLVSGPSFTATMPLPPFGWWRLRPGSAGGGDTRVADSASEGVLAPGWWVFRRA